MIQLFELVNLISYIYFLLIISVLVFGLCIGSEKFLGWGSFVLNIFAFIVILIILHNTNNVFPKEVEINGVKYEKIEDFPIITGYNPVNFTDTIYINDQTIEEFNVPSN